MEAALASEHGRLGALTLAASPLSIGTDGISIGSGAAAAAIAAPHVRLAPERDGIVLARRGGDDRGGDDRGGARGGGRGADDGPNHNAGDDRGRRGGGAGARGRGADDGPNHDAGDDRGPRGGRGRGRGADDGPNHR